MEVPQRYAEQFQTTVETMRRRGLAMYDLGVKIGKKSKAAADRALEVAEPIAFDCRDHVVQACYDQEPMELEDKDTRHNILELYLALCVLMVGIGSGELMGSMVLSNVISSLFDPWVQVGLLFALPSYVYLNFRKNAGKYLLYLYFGICYNYISYCFSFGRYGTSCLAVRSVPG